MAVANHLVGRVEESRSLDHLLDELDHGHSAVIEFVGEPGIGKTRLLREAVARADGRGHLVLSGSGSELEHDLPFSVFVDAVDEYLGGLEPGRLSIDEQVRGELAHVFPSLSALAGAHEVAVQQERYRSHRAIRTLFEQLAAWPPLVLVLDDFHWADSASVELLRSLLRRPPAGPVLIALARRPRQTPERLAAALERAHRDGMLTSFELGALGPDEVRAFLGEAVGQAEASVLYEESGGNPFYLEQLARAWERTAQTVSAVVELGLAIEVPSAVAASLAEELSMLSDTARLVLEGAAVAGDPFELELAAAGAGVSENTAMHALDELLQRDVVRQTDAPRRFRFRHPLLWRAVYESTWGGWRLGAHERCFEALTARGASVVARAYHVERSAAEGDLAAVAVLREAGESAARLAPMSAARWFGAALRLLPATAPEERVALLVGRASCLAATGHFVESRADLLNCIDILSRGGEGPRRTPVITTCAMVEQLLGLQMEAHRHLMSALSELADEESADAVELMIALAVDRFHAGDFDEMRDWGTSAVGRAEPLGDRPLLAAALAVRAWAGAVAGVGHQAQAHCDEATELVDALSDEDLAERLSALAHLASADLFLDRFQAATRHAQRALDIGRATGQGELFPNIAIMLGGSLWVQGRPLEAGEVFEGAVEGARLSGNVHSLAWNLFNRSCAALAAGDIDLALATAEESFELEGSMEPGVMSATAACVLAAVLLETGQAERSVDLLLTQTGGEELGWIGGAWRARFLELLTRALLATGRRPEAVRAAAAAYACADAVALPSAVAMARLASAALALDADDSLVAAESALAAALALESVNAEFDAARARELAGRALGSAGDHEGASRELRLAAAAFESFGALRYRDQVERELRKLGFRIHRRSRLGEIGRFGMESLTERELQVARLVVDRKTNREIGAELFISQKTVETHLRNIFYKMSVSSRVELARAVQLAGQRFPTDTQSADDRVLAGGV